MLHFKMRNIGTIRIKKLKRHWRQQIMSGQKRKGLPVDVKREINEKGWPVTDNIYL